MSIGETEGGAIIGALIWCPFPDEKSAHNAISKLLTHRLIACGNIVPRVQSYFMWQGAEGQSNECGALLKTASDRLPMAMEKLESLHPYETPAITGWTVHTTEGTLRWLVSETRGQ